MKQAKVKILDNQKIRKNYFKLSFKSPWPVEDIKPGQFLEVKINGARAPFLRKPFSFHSVKKSGVVEILYNIIGEGTRALSQRPPGEYIDVIGPLGNGFDYQSPVSATKIGGSAYGGTGFQSPVLVAGGIGVAPLLFLAEKLKKVTSIVLIGAKTKGDILCEKEFKNLGCDVRITTDDGSKGRKGLVTDLLKRMLRGTRDEGRRTKDDGRGMIYACGPKQMLKETAAIAKTKKMPCEVLLEEYMACGVGVCLGCAVKVRAHDARERSEAKPPRRGRNTQYEYKMVCKDGPVFKAGEVIWE